MLSAASSMFGQALLIKIVLKSFKKCEPCTTTGVLGKYSCLTIYTLKFAYFSAQREI